MEEHFHLNAVNPRKIRLEASSYCQLRCPLCPTTTGAIDAAIGRGFLKADNFAALLDKNPQVREIELSNYGEILLNPELPEILRIAHEKQVAVFAENGVNLNSASPEALDAIVRYGLRRMTCSIDGASEETYAKYRVRGSYTRVIANIRRINEIKAQLRSQYPELVWQFVAFDHNLHELKAARALASELNMKFFLKLAWGPEPALETTREELRREVGAASREEYEAKNGVPYLGKICHELWDSPAVNWDGKMLGCCRNFWGDFGSNAMVEGIEAAANSEKMRYAREMLTGNAAARDDIPCTTCEIYHSMQKSGKWVTRPKVTLRGKLEHQIKKLRAR